MQAVKQINKSQGWGYQFIAWIIFYYFWYRYFVTADTRLMANLFAAVTTFFAVAVFYITIYLLAPSQRKAEKPIYFILTAVIFTIVISFFRTISILVLVRLFPAKAAAFNFMGQFFTSLFHISYVLISGMAIKFYTDKQREQLKAEKEMKERLAAELEFLKSQVNPHFLFNIHNSIYFLIRDDPRRAEKAILLLSEIMRYQIYECNGAFVSLDKELHNISNYVELEKIRMGNKVHIEYAFNDGDSDFIIAPFILLSLVENAFKHISDFTGSSNFINITAGVKENDFYMSVANSTEETIENNSQPVYPTGIGLKNLLRRLELIYGSRQELILSRQNKLFTVSLKIAANDTEKPHR
jgi:two-component system, LytTR family, sensor kinase